MVFHQKVHQSACFRTKSTETATFLQQFIGLADFTQPQVLQEAGQEHLLQPVGSVWWKWVKKDTVKVQSRFKMVAFYLNSATILLATELKKLGFNVYGEPRICCIGFDHPKYSLSAIQKFIKSRHLEFSLNQKPMSFHFSFTPLNSTRVNEMVEGFKECIKSFELDPPKK